MIFQVIAIGLLDIVGKITEEHKRRYRCWQLSDVFDLDGMSPYHGRTVTFDGFQHHFIQRGSGHFALAVGIHFQCRFNGFVDAGFVNGRNENDGNIRKRGNALLQTVLIIPCRMRGLFHKVPFVDQQHDPLPFFHSKAEDIQILRTDPFYGIQQQQADIGFIHGLDGADDRIKFKVLMHFRLSSDTGCIDEDEFFLEEIVPGVDRVPGGAGDLTYDGALLPHQCIEQGGFPDIGLPNDGKFWQFGLALRICRLLVVDKVCNCIENFSGTAAADRAEEKNRVEAEAVKFCCFKQTFGIVHFVHCEQYRFLRSAQNICHCKVKVCDTRSGIYHEYDGIRLFNGNHHLLAYLPLKHILTVGNKTTGIDDVEGFPSPFGNTILAVARNTTHIIHNRFPLLKQAIEKSAFAHVGPAGYRKGETHEGEFGKAKLALYAQY